MKQSLLFISGMIIGGSLGFVAAIASPDICRQIVLNDMKDSAAYSAKLAAVMPSDSTDFVTAMTRGRK